MSGIKVRQVMERPGIFIDGTTLPSTGTYTIAVDPVGHAVGNLTLTLSASHRMSTQQSHDHQLKRAYLDHHSLGIQRVTLLVSAQGTRFHKRHSSCSPVLRSPAQGALTGPEGLKNVTSVSAGPRLYRVSIPQRACNHGS